MGACTSKTRVDTAKGGDGFFADVYDEGSEHGLLLPKDSSGFAKPNFSTMGSMDEELNDSDNTAGTQPSSGFFSSLPAVPRPSLPAVPSLASAIKGSGGGPGGSGHGRDGFRFSSGLEDNLGTLGGVTNEARYNFLSEEERSEFTTNTKVSAGTVLSRYSRDGRKLKPPSKILNGASIKNLMRNSGAVALTEESVAEEPNEDGMKNDDGDGDCSDEDETIQTGISEEIQRQPSTQASTSQESKNDKRDSGASRRASYRLSQFMGIPYSAVIGDGMTIKEEEHEDEDDEEEENNNQDKSRKKKQNGAYVGNDINSLRGTTQHERELALAAILLEVSRRSAHTLATNKDVSTRSQPRLVMEISTRSQNRSLHASATSQPQQQQQQQQHQQSGIGLPGRFSVSSTVEPSVALEQREETSVHDLFDGKKQQLTKTDSKRKLRPRSPTGSASNRTEARGNVSSPGHGQAQQEGSSFSKKPGSSSSKKNRALSKSSHSKHSSADFGKTDFTSFGSDVFPTSSLNNNTNAFQQASPWETEKSKSFAKDSELARSTSLPVDSKKKKLSKASTHNKNNSNGGEQSEEINGKKGLGRSTSLQVDSSKKKKLSSKGSSHHKSTLSKSKKDGLKRSSHHHSGTQPKPSKTPTKAKSKSHKDDSNKVASSTPGGPTTKKTGKKTPRKKTASSSYGDENGEGRPKIASQGTKKPRKPKTSQRKDGGAPVTMKAATTTTASSATRKKRE